MTSNLQFEKLKSNLKTKGCMEHNKGKLYLNGEYIPQSIKT